MVDGIAASGVFYIGCPRCARVEGLWFFLPDVFLYHTVSNLQLTKQTRSDKLVINSCT
jgi:hypothetical protein